jgi:hypothetical protein
MQHNFHVIMIFLESQMYSISVQLVCCTVVYVRKSAVNYSSYQEPATTAKKSSQVQLLGPFLNLTFAANRLLTLQFVLLHVSLSSDLLSFRLLQ